MSHNSVSSVFVIQNALLAAKLAKKVGNRLSVHGISLTEYLVMDCLSQASQKVVSRIALAEQLGMSASGVTRLIAPMEKNNIIEKEINPRDARQSLVKLSKTGQRLYREANTSFEHIAIDVLHGVSEIQQEKTLELYKKI